MKTKIVLVRHGVTEANLKDQFSGRSDINLSITGYRQAKAVAKRLNKEFDIDLIYSSSLRRTLQTAMAISKDKNLQIIPRNGLIELDFGDWEGKTHTEIALRNPRGFVAWKTQPHSFKMPNGEGFEDVQARLVEEINYIAKNNFGKTICIVSHGVCIKALMCYFHGYKLAELNKVPWSDNAAISVIEFDKNSFKVLSEADNTHLVGDLKTEAYMHLDTLLERSLQMLNNTSKVASHS